MAQLTFLLGSDPVDATAGSLPTVGVSLVFEGKADTIAALIALVVKYSAVPQVPVWQAFNYRRQFHMGDVVVCGLDLTTGYSVIIAPPSASHFGVNIAATVTGPNGSETDSINSPAGDADYAQYFAANAVQKAMTLDASLGTFG